MALKTGKNLEEIKQLAAERKRLLEQGDITDKYSELMIDVTPDDLGSVNKNNDKAFDNILNKAKDKVVELDIKELSESPKNHFSKISGEKREEMIGSLKSYGQINPIIVRPKECVQHYKELIVSLFIAFVVIDGPNLSERLLGIDAGLSSSFARTMAIFGMARTAANVGRRGVSGGIKGAINTGRTAKTGTTAQERRQASGYASVGESIGKKVHNKFGNKNGEKSDENTGSEKSSYKPADFMNDGKASSSREKANGDTLASSSKAGSGYAASTFMNEGKTSEASQSDFMDSSPKENNSGNAGSQNSRAKFSNPEFSKKVKELAPGKDASVGERRDFNRQVNNIVKGNHKAIKPDEKSRADYKETKIYQPSK